MQLYRLEIFLSTLVLPFSPCSNDATLIDVLLNSGWKGNALRLVNQTRVCLQVYFISALQIPGSNKIKRCFLLGNKHVSTRSKLDWPVVRTNKDYISAWKNAMSEIIIYDGTLRQSFRWTRQANSHVETIVTVNSGQTVICLKVSGSDIRHYAADANRSSRRYKRCHVSQNFISSAKTHVDVSSSD